MAESEPVARLRAAYDAYNSGDVAGVLDLIDDDIEICPPSTSVEPEPFRGREALLRYLEPNLFEFQVAEPREFVEEGDRVLVIVDLHARGRESGVELNDVAYHLWTAGAGAGRAVRFEIFVDRAEAFRALRA